MNIFQHRWVDRVFIGIIFFLLYFLTLNHGILPADNGEFQLVARDLGLAHPPGFGLYTVIAHFFSRLPFPLEPIVRVNLLSVLIAVATLLLVYEASVLVSKSRLGGVVSAGVLGTMTTFWVQATVANIRTMTAFFAVLLIYLAIRGVETQNLASLRGWFVLSLGLAGTHHLSLAFMGLVLVLFVGWHDRKHWREWWRVLPWGIVGILPWGYLLWREPSLREWDKFWEYALALGFSGDFFAFAGGGLGARMRVMVDVLTLQVSPVLLVCALVGGLVLIWRNRWLGGLLLGCFAIHTVVSAIYRAPQTVEYMLPAYVILAIWIGGLLTPYLTGFIQPKRVGNLSGFCGLAILVGLGIRLPNLGLDMWEISQGSRYRLPLVAELPENTLVASNWHWFAPWQYWAEGRDDVEVVYLPPQGEDYRLNWRDVVVEGGDRPLLTTNLYPDFMESEGVQVKNGVLWHAEPDMLGGVETPDLIIKERIEVLGYKEIVPYKEARGEPYRVIVEWQYLGDEFLPFSFFAHQTEGYDQTPIVSQSDKIVIPTGERQFTTFTLPQLSVQMHQIQHQVLIGAYGTPQLDALGNERVVLVPELFVEDSDFPYSANGVVLEEGIIYEGSDGLPQEAVAGAVISVAHRFASTKPLDRDIAISTSATEIDWKWRVQDDSIPALGAIPTLKWMTGTRVRSPHTITIPDDAEPGDEAIVRVILYDAFTSETLAVATPEDNPDGLGIEIGRIKIVAP